MSEPPAFADMRRKALLAKLIGLLLLLLSIVPLLLAVAYNDVLTRRQAMAVSVGISLEAATILLLVLMWFVNPSYKAVSGTEAKKGWIPLATYVFIDRVNNRHVVSEAIRPSGSYTRWEDLRPAMFWLAAILWVVGTLAIAFATIW